MIGNLSVLGIAIIIVLQVILLQSRSAPPVAAPAANSVVTLSPEVRAFIEEKSAQASSCVNESQVSALMAELAKRESLIQELQALRNQLSSRSTVGAGAGVGVVGPELSSQQLLSEARERELDIFRGRIAQECLVATNRPPGDEAEVSPPPPPPSPSTPPSSGPRQLGKPLFGNSPREKN